MIRINALNHSYHSHAKVNSDRIIYMNAKAKVKYLRVSPRKARLVADIIRGLDVALAIDQLSFLQKKAAKPILKLLNSAIANAEHNFELKKDNLYILLIANLFNTL